MTGKWYIVWNGREPGVYESWDECRSQIHGFKGASYKAYKNISREKAEELFRSGGSAILATDVHPDGIAVDASSRGNPGKMEYRGVVVETKDEVFRSQIYPKGTNNMGEFLAIVHAMALMEKLGYYQPIYSDSKVALLWVANKKCKSNLVHDASTDLLWRHIHRAEQWLEAHDLSRYQILKWDTRSMGEIPADFGRK